MTRHGYSRRDFLRRSSGLLAAGSATPYVWSSSTAHAQPASDRLGVASIGVGGRGSGIGHDAGGKGNMVACCDVDRAHAERFAGRYDGRCAIYADYRKLLERGDVDVVTIGTPDHWHTAVAIAALKSGRHVYCEKPLTLTIEEGKQICQVVKETGKVFQVGTQQRSDGRFLLAVAMARSGILGKTLRATCSIGGGPAGGPFETSDPPESLDWDVWLGQTPVVPYTRQRCHGSFRWWLEYSGGKLTDWGAHHIDIAQWGIGCENTGPVEVVGEGQFPQDRRALADMLLGKKSPTEIPNGYNTATQFHVDLEFAGGSSIHVQHGPDNGIWFEGEKGRLFVNRGKITGKPVEDLTQADREKFDAQITALYNGKPRRGHMQNFFDCVAEGGKTVSDVFTHHRAVSSCHLCNIAMLLRRKLRWDPAKEDFIGDAEASALVGRRQRPPYTVEV